MMSRQIRAEGAVVVTGASGGIGRSCALLLDRLGFSVFAGVRREHDGEALTKEASPLLVPIMLDVEDAGSVAAAAETVAGSMPTGTAFWGLVNNAGITVTGPLEFLPPEELRRVLEVNVVGQLVTTQAFLPLLRQGAGRIVNMGSFNGRVAAPFIGPYCASKFAIEGLTDALRLELAPWSVHVSLIEPGSIDTDIWRKYETYTDWLAGVLPEQAQALYGGAIRTARQAARRRAESGVPPQVVAGVVARALTAKRPKTRYVVGWDAKLGVALGRFVPDRLLDEAILRYMKLPKAL